MHIPEYSKSPTAYARVGRCVNGSTDGEAELIELLADPGAGSVYTDIERAFLHVRSDGGRHGVVKNS